VTDDQAQQVALWRYGIIAPLLHLEGPRGLLSRQIRRLAERFHEHPFKGRVRVGWGTIEHWLYDYRKDGLDGLRPRTRKDKGQSRRIEGPMAERITELARSCPQLDGPQLLAELRCRMKEPALLPSLSTLYRFLRARGLDQRRAPIRKDHRAFAFDLAGDCWQSDVLFGPTLPVPDGTR
jgi:putative transposase